MGGEISIGAVGAALIAGMISLLGLIISKEQKTSEFRQAWIDSLRSEITQYLTNLNAIADALTVSYENQADKVNALSPLYSKLNESYFAITLRVNQDEDRSKALLACMVRFAKLTQNDSDMVAAKIRPVEIDFLNASKGLLKYEWNRVKNGEFTFKVTKILSAAVIVGTIIALFFPAGKKPNNEKLGNLSKTSVINNQLIETYQLTTCPMQPQE